MPADNVETTDHTAWHVGLNVVGNAPADDHGSAGHQRCRRQLVVAVRDVAQARLEIDLAVVAEALAELTGIGVDGDQAGVDGVGQQAALAVGAGRYVGGDDRRSVGLGRLCDRRAGIEVGHAAATLPDRRLGVDRVLPQLFASVGIEGDQIVVRGADEHLVADLQRGQLVFGTVAVAEGHITGVIGPGHL
ncbi:hypothetical protein D9M71_336200 [compost metagenome]